MFSRRTYTLDAKNFKGIVDFVLYFQQGCSVADKDEEGPASQQKKGSAVNTINRRSAKKMSQNLLGTKLGNKDISSVLLA